MNKKIIFIIVFLSFFANIFVSQNVEGKYCNTPQKTEQKITAKVLSQKSPTAVNHIILDFVAPPMVFTFAICLCIHIGCTEYEPGTVEWKPKYRKQMPRGNLDYIINETIMIKPLRRFNKIQGVIM